MPEITPARLSARERRRLWIGAIAILAIGVFWFAVWRYTSQPQRDTERVIRTP